MKGLKKKMNNMDILSREFENGWGIDIIYNPNGFADMYSTDYPYSVMTYKRDEGFTSFQNIQYASEVFAYIAEVQRW